MRPKGYHWVQCGFQNTCHIGLVELLDHIISDPRFDDFDFNVIDHRGDTVLHYACSNGQIDVVKLLLENSERRNINIMKQNYGGHIPVQYAQMRGHSEIEALLSYDK